MDRLLPRILAIDPGTKCGYAYVDVKSPILPGLKAMRSQSGLWMLSRDRFQSQGMRFMHLKKQLYDTEPDFIVFEQVNFPHKSTAAAQMYWGCVSIIQTVGEELNIEYVGILTGDLKRRATSKGNSGKDLIVAAANEFFNIDPPLKQDTTSGDDNIADALWLCQIGIERYGSVVVRKAPKEQKNEQG